MWSLLKGLVLCSYLSICAVLQEAVSTGDPEMVQLVLQRRDYLKASTALGGVPELLSKIREVLLHVFSIVSSFIFVCGWKHFLAKKNNWFIVVSSTVSRLLHGNEVGIHQLE